MEPREKKEEERPEDLKNTPQKTTSQKEQEEKKEEDVRGNALRRVLRKIYEEEGGPKITRSIPRAAGRFLGRTLGRGASGSGRGVARLGGRLAVQGAMAAGRAAATGIGAAIANPISLIVIGVIIVIAIIVFLIVFFVRSSGGPQPPTFVCLQPDGSQIYVTDGNTCAQNLASYYSDQEGIGITAKCLDKCTNFDEFATTCDRNQDNLCSNPNSVCGGAFEAFCFEYDPPNPDPDARLYDCNTGGPDYGGRSVANSCGGNPYIPTKTPTPTPP